MEGGSHEIDGLRGITAASTVHDRNVRLWGRAIRSEGIAKVKVRDVKVKVRDVRLCGRGIRTEGTGHAWDVRLWGRNERLSVKQKKTTDLTAEEEYQPLDPREVLEWPCTVGGGGVPPSPPPPDQSDRGGKNRNLPFISLVRNQRCPMHHSVIISAAVATQTQWEQGASHVWRSQIQLLLITRDLADANAKSGPLWDHLHVCILWGLHAGLCQPSFMKGGGGLFWVIPTPRGGDYNRS